MSGRGKGGKGLGRVTKRQKAKSLVRKHSEESKLWDFVESKKREIADLQLALAELKKDLAETNSEKIVPATLSVADYDADFDEDKVVELKNKFDFEVEGSGFCIGSGRRDWHLQGTSENFAKIAEYMREEIKSSNGFASEFDGFCLCLN